jgi:hypothetical protein
MLRHHHNGRLHSHSNAHRSFESSNHIIEMVRTKSGGGFKKAGGFAKKRYSPDDDDSAPRASKKSKGDEEEDSLPVVPELKTDDEGNAYIGVSFETS